MAERERDQYDRPIYGPREVPPPDAYFAQWRGKTCAGQAPYGGNSISGCHPKDPHTRPYAKCTDGWVESGEWWLHCATCRPYEERS